ncbi:MAG TPA: hypothetical protein VN606_09695 [Thermoleophilaceae bacterium]|jgi:hypothetical protein|nr:hypothetical protein [Gemmatimonadales bacterium]HXD58182.1 hypothetical protein [Thermoleophilaceae bacterium]
MSLQQLGIEHFHTESGSTVACSTIRALVFLLAAPRRLDFTANAEVILADGGATANALDGIAVVAAPLSVAMAQAAIRGPQRTYRSHHGVQVMRKRHRHEWFARSLS